MPLGSWTSLTRELALVTVRMYPSTDIVQREFVFNAICESETSGRLDLACGFFLTMKITLELASRGGLRIRSAWRIKAYRRSLPVF